MNEKEPVMIDFEEEVRFIKENTGYSLDVIEKILDAESAFLESKGIIE